MREERVTVELILKDPCIGYTKGIKNGKRGHAEDTLGVVEGAKVPTLRGHALYLNRTNGRRTYNNESYNRNSNEEDI
jgi:hypothetical protein